MIVVAGEALIDITSDGSSTVGSGAGLLGLRGTVGGSPLNAAVAASRLGTTTRYFGGISYDLFGEEIVASLANSHVDTSLVQRSDLPSMLAVATLDQSGNASYTFYLSKVAGTGVSYDDVYAELESSQWPALLLIGGFTVLLEPAWEQYFLLIREAVKRDIVIIIDPNIRLHAIADPEVVRERFRELFSLATVIKLSDDDMDFFTDSAGENFFHDWTEADAKGRKELSASLQAVLVTRGGDGVTVFSAAGKASQPTLGKDIVDTIGAGDSVNGALAHWLTDHNITTAAAVGELTLNQWEQILHWCMRVSAVTVSRSGANPPWLHEVQ